MNLPPGVPVYFLKILSQIATTWPEVAAQIDAFFKAHAGLTPSPEFLKWATQGIGEIGLELPTKTPPQADTPKRQGSEAMQPFNMQAANIPLSWEKVDDEWNEFWELYQKLPKPLVDAGEIARHARRRTVKYDIKSLGTLIGSITISELSPGETRLEFGVVSDGGDNWQESREAGYKRMLSIAATFVGRVGSKELISPDACSRILDWLTEGKRPNKPPAQMDSVDKIAFKEWLFHKAHFTRDELEILCWTVEERWKNGGITHRLSLEVVGGEGLERQCINLVNHVSVLRLLPDLVEEARRMRPDVEFP